MFFKILPQLQRSFIPRSSIHSVYRQPARLLTLLSGQQTPNPVAPNTWNSPIGDEIKISATPKRNEKSKTPEQWWEEYSRDAQSRVNAVDAYAGRTVYIKDGNVAEGYAVLQGILQRNKVRSELRRQERHEKKGEKRRRLNSERWRIRFAHEVRTKVQLVQKIRDRGA